VSLYHRAYEQFQRSKSLMKDSPLTVLGLSTKKASTMSEVVNQAKVLCEDYIYYVLDRGSKDQVDVEGKSQGPAMSLIVTDVSREIQLLGTRLEATYPYLYHNISRQAGLSFRSDANARKALNVIGDYMLSKGVTWGRIISMFAVAAGIAAECVQNDKPETIRLIVHVFADVIERHCASWICQQGGWIEITKAFRFNRETRSLWGLTGLGVLVGFVFTWLTTVQI